MLFPDLTGAIMLGGALAMMLTRIITTEQAYAAIGWKSVFLVAGMLPMGIALDKDECRRLDRRPVSLTSFGGYGAIVLLGGAVRR